MDMATTINASGSAAKDPYWNTILTVAEGFNITILTILAWVMLSVIIFGTKTSRWIRKASASSLSSGVIYVAFTLATFAYLAKIVATEVLHQLPGLKNGLEQCELVCDVKTAVYGISTYACFFFLWLRQRLIYEHPYVKDRVSTFMEWLSKLYIVYFTLTSVILMVFYITPNSYVGKPYGCIFVVNNTEGFLRSEGSNITFAVILFVSQVMMLILCIYPALRVQFRFNPSEHVSENQDVDQLTRKEHPFWQRILAYATNKGGHKSPIELAVKRTVIGSIIIVTTDITAALVDDYAIPLGTPVQVGELLYDISGLVNVFCMIGVFGFAGKILTLCCPAIRVVRTISVKRKSTSHFQSSNT